jgi:hypothetical protein
MNTKPPLWRFDFNNTPIALLSLHKQGYPLQEKAYA